MEKIYLVPLLFLASLCYIVYISVLCTAKVVMGILKVRKP